MREERTPYSSLLTQRMYEGSCLILSLTFLFTECDVLEQKDKLGVSKRELHLLLEDKELENIPILIVGNKTDIRGHMSERDVI